LISMLSCEDGINEGEVYAKEYEPARTQLIMTPMIVSTGKTTITTMTPMYVYDDEDYVIHIHKFNEETQEFDTNTFYTDNVTYNQINVGDWFVYDEELYTADDPDIKKRK